MDYHVWRLIEQTYIKHKHCFIYGCSKKTLKKFIYKTTMKDVKVSEIIKTLKEAENLGLIKADKTIGKCTKYTITGKKI